jgi:DNA repair exonuclease SbcCD ATPase subunit
MPIVKLKFEGGVTPKATSFLTPQKFDMGYEADYDADPSDAAHAKTLQQEFQSAMADAVKKQATELNNWLVQKNALIAELVKGVEALKGKFPEDVGQANAFGQRAAELARAAKQIEDLQADYQQIVSDWAENCRLQQSQVAMLIAVKKARVKTFAAKNFRVKAGLAIKAVLVVAVIALSITAIVLSAGSMAPVVLGLAAAGLALSGISSLGGLAKTIKTNVDTEKKLLANIQQDVEVIRTAMSGVQDKSSKLAKHATELQNLIKLKQDQLAAIENDAKKYLVEANKYKSELARLNALAATALLDQKKLKAKQKASDDINAKLKALVGQFSAIRSDVNKSKELLKGLSDLGVDLAKVTNQAPNTVLGNVKDRFTSIDGWLDVAGTVGGLTGGAAYVIV